MRQSEEQILEHRLFIYFFKYTITQKQ